jgi:hypothetical protein
LGFVVVTHPFHPLTGQRLEVLFAFQSSTKSPFVIDRREEPSFGYRAVHIIIYEEGLAVEVQVRTVLQDIWAQMSEKLGDMWGRDIRYGGQPVDPDTPMFPDEPDSRSRASMLELMMWLSNAINTAEVFQATVLELQAVAARTDAPTEARRKLDQVIRDAATAADKAMATTKERMGNLLAIVTRLENSG